MKLAAFMGLESILSFESTVGLRLMPFSAESMVSWKVQQLLHSMTAS